MFTNKAITEHFGVSVVYFGMHTKTMVGEIMFKLFVLFVFICIFICLLGVDGEGLRFAYYHAP